MSQTHREEQNQISGTYIYTHFSVAYSETIKLESIKTCVLVIFLAMACHNNNYTY